MPDKPTYNHIPALRFPDFTNDGEWEVKRLGEVTKVVNIRNKENKILPIYSINNKTGFVPQSEQFEGVDSNKRGYDTSLYKIVKSHTFAYNPARINVGSIGYSGDIEECLISSLYVCFKTTAEIDDAFLMCYFNTKTFLNAVENSVEGGIRSYLFYENFSKIKISFPPIAEQQRIAACLSAADEMINATNGKLEQLKAYKKGLMQNLFNQWGGVINNINNCVIRRLRFPEFYNEKEWEEKKLGECFMRITERNKENNQNVLTISAQYGLVSQYDYFSKNIASTDVSNYFLISKGDFAYNKSRSQGHPYGAIKSLRLYEKGVVSPLYICFRKMDSDIDASYAEYYFDTGLIDVEIGQIAQEGARNHGLLNISTNDFFDNVSITLPSFPEQRKIASCLSTMDDQINAYTEKVALLGQYKKGLMQRMFSQNQVN